MTNVSQDDQGRGNRRVSQLIHLEEILRGTTGRYHNKIATEHARLQWSAMEHGDLPSDTVMGEPHLTSRRREREF